MNPLLNNEFSKNVQNETEVYQAKLSICPIQAIWIDVKREKKECKDYYEFFSGRIDTVLCLKISIIVQKCETIQRDCFKFDDKNKFPSYLPVDYFLQVKEGEILKMVSPEKNQSFFFSCEQLTSDYKQSGSFERVVKAMMIISYNQLKKLSDRKLLTEKEKIQWENIKELKNKLC